MLRFWEVVGNPDFLPRRIENLTSKGLKTWLSGRNIFAFAVTFVQCEPEDTGDGSASSLQ